MSLGLVLDHFSKCNHVSSHIEATILCFSIIVIVMPWALCSWDVFHTGWNSFHWTRLTITRLFAWEYLAPIYSVIVKVFVHSEWWKMVYDLSHMNFIEIVNTKENSPDQHYCLLSVYLLHIIKLHTALMQYWFSANLIASLFYQACSLHIHLCILDRTP